MAERKHRRRASITERGKDKYLVRIYTGRDPLTGKRQYASKIVLGKRGKAEQYATQELAKLDGGVLALPSTVTLQKHLTDWLENVKRPEIDPRTLASYKFQLEKYIYPGLGSTKLNKVTFERIQRHYNALTDQGYSPRTVQYADAVLSQGLDYAVKLRLLPNNPCQFVSLPKQTQTEKAVFTEQQAADFLEAARQCKHFPLFALALATGLRPGEFLGLRWSDIEGNRLGIRQAVSWLKGGKWSFKELKTRGSRRSVPIGPGVAHLLADHRRKQMEIRLKAGADWQNHDLVFCTTIGTPLHITNLLRRHLRKILDKAKLDASFNLYTLRHSFATLSLASGVHFKVVSARLGHASAKLTMDTYTHVIPSMELGAAERLENVLFGQLAHHSHTEKETGTD